MRISKNIKTDSYGIQFFFSHILKKRKRKKKESFTHIILRLILVTYRPVQTHPRPDPPGGPDRNRSETG